MKLTRPRTVGADLRRVVKPSAGGICNTQPSALPQEATRLRSCAATGLACTNAITSDVLYRLHLQSWQWKDFSQSFPEQALNETDHVILPFEPGSLSPTAITEKQLFSSHRLNAQPRNDKSIGRQLIRGPDCRTRTSGVSRQLHPGERSANCQLEKTLEALVSIDLHNPEY